MHTVEHCIKYMITFHINYHLLIKGILSIDGSCFVWKPSIQAIPEVSWDGFYHF